MQPNDAIRPQCSLISFGIAFLRGRFIGARAFSDERFFIGVFRFSGVRFTVPRSFG